MSRQDGTYPNYKDLKLDIDSPPDYTTSKRCPICELRWPNHDAVKESPCCGSPNVQIDGNPPDFSWEYSISKIVHYWFEKWYSRYDGDINEDVFPWVTEPLLVNELEVESGMRDIERTLKEIENGFGSSQSDELKF